MHHYRTQREKKSLQPWISGFHQGLIYFSCYKITVKAGENDERDVDRKIFLQVSLVIYFAPFIILDKGFIRKEGALNKQ